MTDERFDRLVEEGMARSRAVLCRKAHEYARGDRLSNFKSAAAVMRTPAETAWLGMWIKHVVSIVDLIRDIEYGMIAPEEMWEEKIGDCRNYLYLLEGLLEDRTADKVSQYGCLHHSLDITTKLAKVRESLEELTQRSFCHMSKIDLKDAGWCHPPCTPECGPPHGTGE